MSPLRATTAPDPFADKGAQRFTYSILPHEGALADGDDVAAAAAELNQGVERFDGYAATAKSVLPVAFEGEGVELAVLKKAEVGDGLVVRLVERRGRRATGLLATTIPNAKITPCLATELSDIGPALAAPACLTFRPFEIKTFRIEGTGK
jgi:alpha-mannosidase